MQSHCNPLDNLMLDLPMPFYVDNLELTNCDYRIMDDFPSINDLDPTESVVKKNSRSGVLDKLFQNEFVFQQDTPDTTIQKSQFEFNTEELLDDLEQQTGLKSSTPTEDNTESTLSSIFEKTINIFPCRNSDSTEKVKSFSNRVRFSKKHDRGRCLILYATFV